MNLGVYITNLGGQSTELDSIVDNINQGIKDGSLEDASIFYDTMSFVPTKMECGCFHSTDLWSFTGDLIITSIESAKTALDIVNKFNLFYYYDWNHERNTIGLIDIVKNTRVKTICRNDKDAQELYRLTGTRHEAIIEDFNLEGILKVST